jgi:hypothetical protein
MKRKKGPPLDTRAVINHKNPNSFDVYNVKGQALRHYEKMCHKIVQFLEQAYSVRIQRIVLDFITDNNNKVWLFNCRSIRIDTQIYLKSKEMQ